MRGCLDQAYLPTVGGTIPWLCKGGGGLGAGIHAPIHPDLLLMVDTM